MMINVISKRKYFLGISVILVLVSLVLIATLGLRQGIDLTGGTKWQFKFESEVSEESLRSVLASDMNVTIKTTGDGSFIVFLPPLDEESHQFYLNTLREQFGDVTEESFSSIGPTIGLELRRRSMLAAIFVLLGVSIFVTWAFRTVSKPVKSWKYGMVTLITLFHDVIIPTGLLAVLGWWQGVEIDTNFIVALLVVMGFSVHDTIVVFDRIRENLMINKGKKTSLGDIINYSVNQTLARSINTSLTLIVILVAILLMGPDSLFYFILTILVGTIVGTYSSVFVASPLLYLWRPKEE